MEHPEYKCGVHVEGSPPSTVTPSLVAGLTLLLVASSFIYKDYTAFVNLGPGGTPCNFLGYLRIVFLRFFALRNPYDPAPLPGVIQPAKGLLHPTVCGLSRREGPRPKVAGIAPQRQTTQKGSSDNFTALAERIKALAGRHSTSLRLGTSCFEKHGTALFSRRPLNRTCNGEICHAHPSDGSLHMTLHPQDARVVLERGWGERHPLAKGGWLSRFVPAGFVMIYAPRDVAELEAVMEIIRAAAWWTAGKDVEMLELPDEGTSHA
ncbi:MAG: hypothetical protein M1832_004801 [Thelocarpon impressellum]|nr:MAG: hypothetical protein M1832_004801 [Thelocarpon impressellum]